MVVAFSGGVDSSLVLAAAHEANGGQVVAATAVSKIHPRGERKKAEAFARERNIRHLLFSSNVTDMEAFTANPADRCYHCKKQLFDMLWQIADQMGISQVVHGANVDDLNDYRPGMRAAEEMGVLSPLIVAGLNKHEVRSMAREMGLSTWDKPATACLATRIPYGTAITAKKLDMIEQAEALLFRLGIGECRVRHHGNIARIELKSADMATIMKGHVRDRVVDGLQDIGFSYVTMDLEEHESGAMNRMVNPHLISRHKGGTP
jgi:uncharacterized protein